MSHCQFVNIKFGDLHKRQTQFIRARRNIPKDVAKFVFQLPADLVIDHASVIALDLFNYVGNLARFAGKTECRIFEIVQTFGVQSRLARFRLVFFKFHILFATEKNETK